MPNPRGSGLPNEAVYTDLGDTVRDEITCLEWEKAQSDPVAERAGALAYCDSLVLSGKSDWRLPTRIEAQSIVDVTQEWPIDAQTFIQDQTPSYFYTMSDAIGALGSDTGQLWTFLMGRGLGSGVLSLPIYDARVHCVRGGGAGEGRADPAAAPPNLYAEVAPGEVRDNYTGLVWQRGFSENPVPHDGAAPYCAALGLGGNTWRVPSVRELATLVDEARYEPAIDPDIFPNTRYYDSSGTNSYWAVHRNVYLDDYAWSINFNSGETGCNDSICGAQLDFTEAWVKCVR